MDAFICASAVSNNASFLLRVAGSGNSTDRPLSLSQEEQVNDFHVAILLPGHPVFLLAFTARPPENNDFLTHFFLGGSGKSRAKEVDANDLVS